MNSTNKTLSRYQSVLKKQKKRSRRMFFYGVLTASFFAVAFFYAYPLVAATFNLPPLQQPTPPVTVSTTASTPEASTAVTPEASTTESTPPTETIPAVTRPDLAEAAKYLPLTQKLEQTIRDYNPSGTFLAIKDNQVVLYQNYGNAALTSTDPVTSTYLIASVQKMITATLIMKLIDQQKLTLQTSLATYFPTIPHSEQITIDQLLSMTSGLTLSPKMANPTSEADSLNYMLNNIQYAPIHKWTYSDVNFFILAHIIETVTGGSYADFYREIIGQPLNLTHTGFYTELAQVTQLIPSYKLDDNGYLNDQPEVITTENYLNELGTGNMYTTAGDLVTFLQGLLDHRLVSADTLKKTLVRQKQPYHYSYKAGYYATAHFNYGHGIFHSYEPALLFNKDASTLLVFFSNTYTKNKSNAHLGEALYKELTTFKPVTRDF